MSNKSNSIIFISGGLGDQLLHFNQIRAIAQKDNFGKVDIACFNYKIMKKISVRCTWINEIIDISPNKNLLKLKKYFKFLSKIKKNDYTYAYIFHKSTSFKISSWILQIPYRVGVVGSKIDKFLINEPINEKIYEKKLRWGHRPFIESIENYLKENNFNLQDKTSTISSNITGKILIIKLFIIYPRPWFIVNLYVESETRRWPLDHAISILYECNKSFKGSFFLNSGNDGYEYHNNLIRLSKNKIKNLILTKDFYENILSDIDLYSTADFYLGVNSFTANLAFNCNLFSFVLYGKKEDILRYRGNTIAFFPQEENLINSIGVRKITNSIKNTIDKK